MNKKKIASTILVMAIVVVAIVGVYYYLSNRIVDKGDSVEIPKTTVEQLIQKDMDLDYPATPKTVVQLYSQFSKCFYDKQYDETEYKQLVSQYRNLLDQELLVNNPEDGHIDLLAKEVDGYSDEKRYILSFYEPEGSEVKTYKSGGKEYATVQITYALREGDKTVLNTVEEFILRKDNDGKWRILGWRLAK